jgi:hypothetical protein
VTITEHEAERAALRISDSFAEINAEDEAGDNPDADFLDENPSNTGEVEERASRTGR